MITKPHGSHVTFGSEILNRKKMAYINCQCQTINKSRWRLCYVTALSTRKP